MSGKKELSSSKSAKIFPFNSVTEFAAFKAFPIELLTDCALDSRLSSPEEMELLACPRRFSPCETEPERAEEKSPAALLASFRVEIEFSSAEAPDVAEFFKDSEVLAAFAMEDSALAVSEEKVWRSF